MDISSVLCDNLINKAKHTGMIKQITEDITMAKTLIAFFSRADENYFGGAMRYVKVGNTEIVASMRIHLRSR